MSGTTLRAGFLPLFLGAVVWLLSPAGLAAQDQDEVLLRGVVVDETTGQGIPRAFVILANEDRGIVADENGAFEGLPATPGPQLLEIQALGYGTVFIPMTITDPPERLELVLKPDPVLLEGVTVMHDRFQRRRNAVATSVRVFDREQLATSGSWDALDFLRLHTSLAVIPCDFRSMGHVCVRARGRAVEPQVYIDEMRAFGGLERLEMYQPWELHMLEVFAGGRQIRAYTHHFMERVARSPRALFPIFTP